jgi:hypothetical protein
MKTNMDADKAVLMAAFAKFDVIALAIALGTVLAALLFMATIFLLLKGADPGTDVGNHLRLIGVYLPGYSVSWSGAIVGAAYALGLGAILGFVLGVLWNMTHYIYVALIVIRTTWVNLMAD